MGNIFSGETIELLTEPARCTLRDQACTCSFHFESNAVVGAEDRDNYERMKDGPSPNIADKFFEVARNKDFKFSPRKRDKSQGTEIGEKILIYEPRAALEALLGTDRHESFAMSAEQAGLLESYKDGVNIEIKPDCIVVKAPEKIGGGVRFSVPTSARNRSCITFKGKVLRGNVTIAVYSGTTAHFWHLIPKFRGRDIVTQAFTPEEDAITIYVYSDEPVEFEFEEISLIEARTLVDVD
jgi:hypothetical protein